MKEKFPEPEFKDKILDEMREFHGMELPKAQEDRDLIWLLSGPPIDIAKEFKKRKKGEKKEEIEEVVFTAGDNIAKKDVERRMNESNARLSAGIKVAKEVAAKRLGKDVGELIMEDIRNFSPDVYWNGTDWSNDNFRQRINEGWVEKKYDFPREKIVISPNLGILHTGHQFEKFPEKFIDVSRKIVLVSDIYHLPRAKRYLHEKFNKRLAQKMNKGEVILYPSGPKIPYDKARGEIDKIPGYQEKGILPLERE